jgi:hypothetical protein
MAEKPKQPPKPEPKPTPRPPADKDGLVKKKY